MLRLGVVAYERGMTVEYPSLSECQKYYGISDRDILVRMIELRQVWPGDGYTTFDWAIDASPRLIANAVARSRRHYKWNKEEG